MRGLCVRCSRSATSGGISNDAPRACVGHRRGGAVGRSARVQRVAKPVGLWWCRGACCAFRQPSAVKPASVWGRLRGEVS